MASLAGMTKTAIASVDAWFGPGLHSLDVIATAPILWTISEDASRNDHKTTTPSRNGSGQRKESDFVLAIRRQ